MDWRTLFSIEQRANFQPTVSQRLHKRASIHSLFPELGTPVTIVNSPGTTYNIHNTSAEECGLRHIHSFFQYRLANLYRKRIWTYKLTDILSTLEWMWYLHYKIHPGISIQLKHQAENRGFDDSMHQFRSRNPWSWIILV